MKTLLKKISLTLALIIGTISIPTFAQTLDKDEINKTIIIERGNVLTDTDFSEIYKIYEKNLLENNKLTDSDVLDLIVKRIDYKLRNRSYNIFGQSVTKEELKLVALHPIDATKVLNNSKVASNETFNLYHHSTHYLGNGDAFRHAYWNALNVKSVGITRAAQFANAHESETKNGVDKDMDLRNNDRGRAIGQDNRYASDSAIKQKIITAVNNGGLWRVVNGRLVKTDSSGRN